MEFPTQPQDVQPSDAPASTHPISLRLLGPIAIRRRGEAVALPASRKVRALLAWLALAPRAVTREALCDLLWDAPSDPRGELRWCLSKIRSLVDDEDRRRLRAQGDDVRLDLSDAFVDAVEVERALARGLPRIAPQSLQSLASSFAGEFLDGLSLARTPVFDAWLAAQRRRFRSAHATLLEQLATKAEATDAVRYLEQWLIVEPFELRAHRALLDRLARSARWRDAEAHFELAQRMFDGEGLDPGPLRAAWRALREQFRPGIVVVEAQTSAAGVEASGEHPTGRASIAVMPFADEDAGMRAGGGTATALAHDVVTRLAKLRSLFVIAQGSATALHERGVHAPQAARLLNVDYACSGAIRRDAGRESIEVELVDTRTSRVVWTERFDLGDPFGVLDEIGNRIVASLAAEIEALERNRAILLPPSSLDAWSAHHRGLWHMYRFDEPDNAAARRFFETAVRLDPTFSRAWAGLSFTHFQNAFQGWTEREPEVERAHRAAAQALMADERDPSAHWAMGRALWLSEGLDASVRELEQSVDLSPNFALAHYTLAFVQAQSGDPRAAIAASDRARHLSPFDPLLFGMYGARAIALVRLGEFGEAAQWAVRAAERPNAHPHIHAIAAFALARAGLLDAARRHAAAIRKVLPAYRYADFAAAFRLDPEASARFEEGARRIGM